MPGPRSLPGGSYVWSQVPWESAGAYVWKGAGMYTLMHGTWDTQPLLLIPSGSLHNMYGWQAGGMHPTGIRSCF